MTYEFDPDGADGPLEPAAITITTPAHDGDPDTPDWQCPEGGLAIHDLVYKHRPVMHFDSQEISTITAPLSISFALNRASIRQWSLAIDPSGTGFVRSSLNTIVIQPDGAAGLTLDDLGNHSVIAQGQQPFFLDHPDGDRTAPPAWPARGIYYTSGQSGLFVYIQYWFYYPTSYLPALPAIGSIFRHEGGWEMLQFTVRVRRNDDTDTADVDESAEPFWLAPFAVTASQHFYGQTLKWKEEDGDNPPTSPDQDYVVKVGGFQPVVFVAARSCMTRRSSPRRSSGRTWPGRRRGCAWCRKGRSCWRRRRRRRAH